MTTTEPAALAELARQRIVRLATAFEMMCGALEAARHAVNEAIKGVEEERDTLLKECNTEMVGYCMACDTMLLRGDLGYRDKDRALICAPCAPTWRLLGVAIEETLDDSSDQPLIDEFLARRTAYLQSGGGLDDPVGEPL